MWIDATMTQSPTHLLLIFLIIASLFICGCINSKEDYKTTVNYTTVKWNGSDGIRWAVPPGATCTDYYVRGYTCVACEGGGGCKVDNTSEFPDNQTHQGGFGHGEGTPQTRNKTDTPTFIGSTNWNSTTLIVGSGGTGVGWNDMPPFNSTACNEDAAKLGANCTCMECGYWMSYETQGFYNLSGVYYSDGTPTGRTMKQMDDYETMQSNIRYSRFMNEHGIYWNGKKWQTGREQG
jgi:hypothetical protein